MKLFFSVVMLDECREVFRGLYLECLEYLWGRFREVEVHGVVIVKSSFFDEISKNKLG